MLSQALVKRKTAHAASSHLWGSGNVFLHEWDESLRCHEHPREVHLDDPVPVLAVEAIDWLTAVTTSHVHSRVVDENVQLAVIGLCVMLLCVHVGGARVHRVHV
jgi:hypothetical protein